MLDTLAQDIDHAVLADLALEPREKLQPRGIVLAQVDRLSRLRLRCTQESREVRKVHAVLPVVVGGIAADVPRSAIGGPRARQCARAPAPGRTRCRSAPRKSGARVPSRWCRSSRLACDDLIG